MENQLIDIEEIIGKLREILSYLEKINKSSVTSKLSHDFINPLDGAHDNGKD